MLFSEVKKKCRMRMNQGPPRATSQSTTLTEHHCGKAHTADQRQLRVQRYRWRCVRCNPGSLDFLNGDRSWQKGNLPHSFSHVPLKSSSSLTDKQQHQLQSLGFASGLNSLWGQNGAQALTLNFLWNHWLRFFADLKLKFILLIYVLCVEPRRTGWLQPLQLKGLLWWTTNTHKT